MDRRGTPSSASPALLPSGDEPDAAAEPLLPIEPTMEVANSPTRAGTWVSSGQHEIQVDGAIYAWAEPRFHAWSSVLPILLLPPGVHVVFHDEGAPHRHTWLWAFLAVWLVAWLLAVPYVCRVAYADGRVVPVRCGTRGTALRLAAKVCRHLGVPARPPGPRQPAHGA